MGAKYDFSGWATRNDLECADGRTIRKDAFKINDGKKVPLVWNHKHDGTSSVLGHALLENRPEGVYAYGFLNDTQNGKDAKILIQHGDINALSIFANQLQQKGSNIVHGIIREVSLVLAGANPGAFIDSIILAHGEESEDEAIIYTDELIDLSHSVDLEIPGDGIKHPNEPKDEKDSKETKKEESKDTKDEDETIKDVFDSLNEKQKTVVYAMLADAKEGSDKQSDESQKDDKTGGDKDMKHNVFEPKDNQDQGNTLSHDAMDVILKDAKKTGLLSDSVLAHSAEYGIENIEYLFPEARTLNNTPEFIKRKTDWVTKVINGAHHSPFARIKSIFADITADEARAKGYIKGNLKKEEVFTLLKRTTEPTTIFKKQKLDRDDVVDIVDFDSVAFVKSEMRIMLDEEIARASLIGDGRLASSDDKVPEDHIRPIWTDSELFSIPVILDLGEDDELAEVFIDSVISAMADYEGSGSPTLFAPQSIVTACLLLKDLNKHRLYKTVEELATALQVSEIVPVPVMKNQTRVVSGTTRVLDGIVVNMNDYNIGADKGGSINMFEDFDIDFNQMKYLIETRCSGALTKPKSALIIEHAQA